MTRPSFLPYRDRASRASSRRESNPLAAAQPTRWRWLRAGEPRSSGRYVLYWMQMNGRAFSNLALNEAIRRARDLRLPLVVYQGLNPDYPEANDRIHRFILETARDTARDLAARGIPYVFALRRRADEGIRPAVEMIRDAAIVVVDDFPAFILPRVSAWAVALTSDTGVPVLAFDANGAVPLAEIPGPQHAARTIRPRIHRLLPDHLWPVPELEAPAAQGVALPCTGIEDELVKADEAALDALLAGCEIDHRVQPAPELRGGRSAALARLASFVDDGLVDYAERARDPGAGVTSALSPYLHFGCVSPQEVAIAVLASGAPIESIDAFLEQLIVRRELAFNFCYHSPHHQDLEALPGWAQKSLAEHRGDVRHEIYDEAVLEAAATADPVWNAAQTELLARGVFHSYMRMLWGKKLIEWSATYEQAQERMIRFHHRYALDGRNPNTYANILWCFGLHDRPFAERPILGELRPLSSERTAKKFDLDPYFRRVEALKTKLADNLQR